MSFSQQLGQKRKKQALRKLSESRARTPTGARRGVKKRPFTASAHLDSINRPGRRKSSQTDNEAENDGLATQLFSSTPAITNKDLTITRTFQQPTSTVEPTSTFKPSFPTVGDSFSGFGGFSRNTGDAKSSAAQPGGGMQSQEHRHQQPPPSFGSYDAGTSHDAIGSGTASGDFQQPGSLQTRLGPTQNREGHSGSKSHKMPPQVTDNSAGIFKRSANTMAESRDLSQESYEEGLEGDGASYLETFGDRRDKKMKKVVFNRAVFGAEGVEGKAPGKPLARGLFGNALDTMSGRQQEQQQQGFLVEGDSQFISPAGTEPAPSTGGGGDMDGSRPLSTSPKEVSQLTGVIVKGIPDRLNNKEFVKTFFGKFGRIKRAFCHLRLSAVTIVYHDHASAEKAKKRGRILEPGTKPVAIFYKAEKRGRSVSTDENQAVTDHAGQQQAAVESVTAGPAFVPNPAKSPAKVPFAVSQSVDNFSGRAGVARDLIAPFTGGKIFRTASERYELLVQRDKLLRSRLNTKKQADLASAKVMVGNCPDMCPEKERYMRDYQHRLSFFEVLSASESMQNQQVNHRTAVKEYSRSSADQDEPLPHELRPAPVLTMTMDYLATTIMDAGGDGRWAEWYDFLWNRTRGIRKDLTQQQVTSQVAVDLVQKCSRFHIFCAHHLCDEDRSVFDPKINSENLTKCQQSLKHFYYDLSAEGTHCPNEAEFRAYDILLNLNQGDTLREVQQLRPEIQEAETVQFALKVFHAVGNNNFVRFFKLVRMASYLNACIMHRYFFQVRTNALKVLNTAYSAGRTPTNFPISDLIRWLGFDDSDEVISFCTSHGLSVSGAGSIQFSRPSFVQPVLTSPKSLTIIETKKQGLVGEVVYGGPLPQFTLHEPVMSFDPSGTYVGDPTIQDSGAIASQLETSSYSNKLTNQRQPANQTFQPSANQQPASQAFQPLLTNQQQSAKYPNQVVKEVTKELILDVINDMTVEISHQCLQEEEILVGCITGIAEDLLSQVAGELCGEIIEEEQRASDIRKLKERLEAEKRVRKVEERRASLERVAVALQQDIVNTVLSQEILRIAEQQARAVEVRLDQESLQRCTSQIAEVVTQQAVDQLVVGIASSTLQQEAALRDRRLARALNCVVLLSTAKFFKRWKNAYAKQLRMKRSVYNFPSAPVPLSAQEQVQLLVGGASLGHIATAATISPFRLESMRERTARGFDLLACRRRLRIEQAWEPLDLAPMADRALCLRDRPRPDFLWKCILSLPEGPETAWDWLRAKFTRGSIDPALRASRLRDSQKVETLSLYTVGIRQTPFSGRTVGVCTKAVTGVLGEEEMADTERRFQLLGSSALVLALTPPDSDDPEVFWLDSSLRLSSLLQAKPLLPPLPLLLLLWDWPPALTPDHARHLCHHHLRLESLKRDQLISAHTTLLLQSATDALDTSDILTEGVEWLLLSAPKGHDLSGGVGLSEFVEDAITTFFTVPLYQDIADRSQSNLLPQEFETVVELYNSVIEHLAAVSTSSYVQSISWPIPEFTLASHDFDLPVPEWNSASGMDALKRNIEELKLPSTLRFNDGDDWETVCAACLQYASQITSSSNNRIETTLRARVQEILGRAERDFEAACLLEYDVAGWQPSWKWVQWPLLVEACLNHKLSSLSPHRDDLAVYYQQAQLQAFTPPDGWSRACLQTVTGGTTTSQCLREAVCRAASEDSQPPAVDGSEEVKGDPGPEEEEGQWAEEVARDRVTTSFQQLRTAIAEEKSHSDRLDNLLALLQTSTNGGSAISKEGLPRGKTGPPRQQDGCWTPRLTEPTGSTVKVEQADLSLADQLQQLTDSIDKNRQEDRIQEMKLNLLLHS